MKTCAFFLLLVAGAAVGQLLRPKDGFKRILANAQHGKHRMEYEENVYGRRYLHPNAREINRLIGGGDHDRVPHGINLLGGGDHDRVPHGINLLGTGDHDKVPHGNLIGRGNHDRVPHGINLLGGGDHDKVPHGHNLLGGDNHDRVPIGNLIGGGNHDRVPHGINLLGRGDHDRVPHGINLLGRGDHDKVPHGNLIGGGNHDRVPHGINILGRGDHDRVPHGHNLLGGGDHDRVPHGHNLLGGDNHDRVPHGHNLLGGGDHDKVPHGHNLLGGGDHDRVPHGHNLLGGGDHDRVSHGHNLLGGDNHDRVPHGHNLLGGDDHDRVPHGHNLLGGDNHDRVPHGHNLLGRDDHDRVSHRKKHGSNHLLGMGLHDFLPHGFANMSMHLKSVHLFKGFMAKHNKTYSTGAEFGRRLSIFRQNLHRIKVLARHEKGSATYGVTKFSDLTASEFKKLLGFRPSHRRPSPHRRVLGAAPSAPLPDTFDWREKGAVTEVKNQGSCGSCWAFSTTGNVEGQWFLKHGELISLSEQELVDCDKEDHGCEGGLPENAYDAIIRMGGIETEEEYPYDGRDDVCHMDKTAAHVRVNGSVELPEDEGKMAQWVTKNGPVSIGINANTLQFYFGGVTHPPHFLCNPEGLDHGVLIVGYGTHVTKYLHRHQPYWLVKNSWGPDWGENGYFRVYRGDGTCGVNKMATSAIVE